MEPPISALLFSVLFFFGMLIMLEIGRPCRRQRSRERDRRRAWQPGHYRRRGFRLIWAAGGIHFFRRGFAI